VNKQRIRQSNLLLFRAALSAIRPNHFVSETLDATAAEAQSCYNQALTKALNKLKPIVIYSNYFKTI